VQRLEGRVAVVTGAAGGIGRATSELLARRGCDLALVDVNEAGLAESAACVLAAGRRASLHVADVSDRARMAGLPAEVLAEHGHAHVLVNNAGVTVSRPFEAHSLEDLDWIVGINFWGVVLGCRAFLPVLRREEEAHVVNLSSMAAFVGMPMQSSYCATKAAVRAFSEALAAELSGSRVGVSSVHPGAVRTGILRAARGDGSPARDRLTSLMERHARPPERVAEAIVRAIERRRFRVVVGAESRLTDWAVRSFPGLPRRLLGWGWRRAGITPGPAPRSG
jgi:NAD(P)-dependent dehydrogenase (short-subunit alcohol dehydrogenase family)